MHPRPYCVGLVLAGGLGTRMGDPGKPFLMLAGRSMLDRAICRLSPQVDQLVISANIDPARFDAYAAPVVADTLPGHPGPLVGILAGMRWAAGYRPDARWIASIAADTPFFPKNLVGTLMDGSEAKGGGITLAASASGIHPTFGLWPISLADDLERFLLCGANPAMLDFADRHPRFTVLFSDMVMPSGKSLDPFFNVNTPSDAERAEGFAVALDALEAS